MMDGENAEWIGLCKSPKKKNDTKEKLWFILYMQTNKVWSSVYVFIFKKKNVIIFLN